MRFILIAILFTSFGALGQSSKPFDFSIIFTELFQTDTIQLSLNGNMVVKDKVVSSFSSGTTGFRVVQRAKQIEILAGEKLLKTYPLMFTAAIKIIVVVNGKANDFSFDFKKGKFLLVGYNTSTARSISFKQTDKAHFF